MLMTLAQLKRDCDLYEWRMIRHDGDPNGTVPPALDGVRRVIKKQTQAIKFSPILPGSNGSWLYFDKAENYKFECDNDTDRPILTVSLNRGGDFSRVMVYQLVKIKQEGCNHDK